MYLVLTYLMFYTGDDPLSPDQTIYDMGPDVVYLVKNIPRARVVPQCSWHVGWMLYIPQGCALPMVLPDSQHCDEGQTLQEGVHGLRE